MSKKSCSNCSGQCKVTQYGPDWACGAWRPEDTPCQFINAAGVCGASRKGGKKAILCRDVEFCTIRANPGASR
jgi:hypothetical protein